jgi:rRNA-processing protein FCF1
MMTATEWAGLAVALMTLLGGFTAAIRWLVKHYLEELKPNGGGSMRDAVNINTERLDRVEQRVDQIYLLLCESNRK